ncbi:MAG: anti-sigma regulatory factor [Tatlockia sp.]|nr:anti-sigma regulatory factor [Tatlockia sp.]
MDTKVNIPIDNERDIVISRQKGREMADNLGFTLIDLALIATAISELTRNILTYAHKGVLIIQVITEQRKKGILVVAIDEGPGIENIELALQDGYSTSANSLGLGLPGVRRLMDDFEIKSELGKGTTVTTKKWVS